MENDVDITIRDEFQKDSNEAKAFLSICKQRDLNVPLESTASDWINRLRDHDNSLEEEIGGPQYRLLCTIIGKYSKFKYAMFYRSDWKAECEAIIQDRIVLSILLVAK